MESRKNILVWVILMVLASGCVKNDHQLNELQFENSRLKKMLNSRQDESKDEQLAIFQYMAFVDSIDKVLNNVYLDFIGFQNDETQFQHSKKQVLLNELNALINKLKRDESRIDDLENNITEQNSKYQKEYDKIVQLLKKERIQQLEKITSLYHQIDSLLYRAEEQNILIFEQNNELQKQKDEIIERDEIIVEQKGELKQAELELERRFVLLISKNNTKKIEMKKPFLIIPKKRRRIQVESPDKEFCKLIQLSNNKTKLIIDDSYWDNNTTLLIRIKGRI